MNIVIAGGGRVGMHLARLLSDERQEITVIESDPGRLEEIDEELDVSSIEGDGSSVMLLQSVGVSAADLFVASMGNDEANLIAAATAKGLGAKQSVARVDNPMYIESHILYETILGLDFILSPEALAALEIAFYVENPGVIASEDFAQGLVRMHQIRVNRSPADQAKPLKDLLPPGTGVLLGVINRHGKSFIPHGDSRIEPGDHVTLFGQSGQLEKAHRLFYQAEAHPRRVAIMGGGKMGLLLAQALEDKVKTVKIFERRQERSEELSEKLTKAKVVCRDAVSRTSLEQEHIDEFDVFVAATRDDERNIMAGVLAKEVGVRDVVAIVHQPDFAPLVTRLGIDLAITPRASIANRIVRLMHQKEVTSLAVIGEGQVEVLEFTLNEKSPLTGKRLKELKIPRGALVAAIMREKRVIVPGGDDRLQGGDHVVVITMADTLEPARKLFQKQ
ncbi:MAG: Trk system potassium transporter TrkA [Candidatus Hydrogenedentota bacterium]